MNYLVWASVVLPFIEGNRLHHHLDGSSPVPPMTVSAPNTNNMVSNPDFEEWFTTDRMLLGWLQNTLTLEITTQLLHCRTSFELWSEAHALTSAVSKSWLMIYRSELHNTLERLDYDGHLQMSTDE